MGLFDDFAAARRSRRLRGCSVSASSAMMESVSQW
jgi:hypothetical protein